MSASQPTYNSLESCAGTRRGLKFRSDSTRMRLPLAGPEVMLGSCLGCVFFGLESKASTGYLMFTTL